MRKFFLTCAVLITAPLAAVAGPKEEAFQVIEQFKAAFDTSDVQGVVKLFAPDAIFLGTISPKIITTTADVDQYFQGLKQFMPRQIKIEEHSTMVLSDRTAGIDAQIGCFSRSPRRPAPVASLVFPRRVSWR
jgi:hypothetical protein